MGDPEEELAGEEKPECGLRIQLILETGRMKPSFDMTKYAVIQCVKYTIYEP